MECTGCYLTRNHPFKLETSSNKIKILILEDSPSDAKLVQHALKKDGLQFDAKVVDTRDEFTVALQDFNPQVVLSDHRLASFDSSEALLLTRKFSADIPFILVTGTVSEEFAVSIIKAGASDYILKGNLSRLAVSILSALSQKDAKEKLKRSEEQFQHTIDGMVDGVQIIGFDWKYLYVNDVVAKQGKNDKKGLLGHTMMEMYPGIDSTEMFRQLKKCMNDRIFIEMENEFRFPDGRKEWFKLSMQPTPQGVLILSRDITDKKHSIEKLEEQNDKIRRVNSELDRFLYSVSHELRGPICSGYGLINLLRNIDATEDKNKMLDKLQRSIANLDTLLQNIGLCSDVMREETVYERIDFKDLFHECVREINDANREVELSISVEGNEPFYSNKRKLCILLKNLISNGIKYRRASISSYVRVNVMQDSHQARITVSDNGCGIKKDHLEKIFKPFYKTHNDVGSHGLGLYIAHQVVENLKGKIEVESKPTEGTTFSIIIPNAKADE